MSLLYPKRAAIARGFRYFFASAQEKAERTEISIRLRRRLTEADEIKRLVETLKAAGQWAMERKGRQTRYAVLPR